jgi:hypothetical protein
MKLPRESRMAAPSMRAAATAVADSALVLRLSKPAAVETPGSLVVWLAEQRATPSERL